ncbi:MAG: hypothetical protein IPP48_02530 [Chitinophagaceae bacterium]|nr:hypothetical protein [Chitinophagaceae bacterium]
MKKIIIFLSMALCFTALAVTSQAQLLKKLKDKAAKALEPKKNTETPAAEGQQTNNEETPSASSKKTKVKWVPTPDCDKLFVLEKGETFLYDETKVIAANGKLSYSFILQNKSYEYFLIEDGKRSGPFKEAPVAQMNIVSDKRDSDEDNGSSNNDDEKIDMGSGKKDAVTAQYSKTINNKLFIVFNGKNFGPYDFISKIKVSPDKKKFWAAVVIGGTTDMMAKMGMGNSFLVNEAGVKQKGGDGASFAAKMMVSQNFGAAALSILDNAGQKAITISSAEKKQEGSMMDLYSDNKSTMMVADNGDILSIPSQSPTQLLVNGNEAAAFKVPVTNMRRLFIFPEYNKSVYYQSGKIYRGDGSEEALSGVTFPRFVTINKQPAIYYYKIYENETGDKEVYLCKKVL